ncbi:MAG TPA: 16S rRNA (guanine(527)-N(7))-methyltransferase RsmG [Thermoleophilaceae bacterium]|nr:16S rRNA (guanine(527)-N(7))-methyltransferase RsmG [Thermoleophilaceae bacterium]
MAALLAALAATPAASTTVREPVEAADVHIADSLSGLEATSLAGAQSIADIGAGAGFPGLVLAVALPDSRFDLIEATARKCEVIVGLASAAQISNATAIPVRAEEWAAADGADRYEIVTARALSSLAVLAEYAAPLLVVGGSMLAWKGARDLEEERSGALAATTLGLEPLPAIPVRPFKGSRERHLYVYRKVDPTPDRFPRRPGMATKRPLAG